MRLAVTLLGGGSMHFLVPTFFDRLIPTQLPGNRRAYTYVFGSAALGIGAGLSVRQTRKVSADLATLFFLAVIPAKIQMSVDWWRSDSKPLPAKMAGVAQLFWQIPLITEARKVRRNAV